MFDRPSVLKSCAVIGTLAATLIWSIPVRAATYNGLRNVSGNFGAVSLQITTDDTLGSLSSFNIVDYHITFANFATFDSAVLTRTNSFLLFGGAGLRATSTELSFDFDGDNRFGASNGAAFYAVDGAGGQSIAQCGFIQPCELLFFGTGNPLSTAAQSGSGISILATAMGGPTGGVPEPTSWALMIAGFGMVGSAIRRRRKVQSHFA